MLRAVAQRLLRLAGASPSQRRIEDATYKARIIELNKLARGRYSHRPIYHHLQDEKVNCGRDRTLRLMKELRIEGRQQKGFKPQATNSNHHFGYSPNLLQQLGAPTHCNQV